MSALPSPSGALPAPPRSRLFTIAAVVALLGALAGSALALSAGALRLADDGAFCARACHEGQLGTVAGGAHATERCTSCHPVSGATRVALGWAAWNGGRGSGPAHGTVDESSCVACHAATAQASLATYEDAAGHRAHARGRGATACTTCHGGEDHRGERASGRCERCHGSDALHQPTTRALARQQGGDAAGGSLELDPDGCMSCHPFAAEPPLASTLRDGCARCHAGGAAAPVGAAAVGIDATHGTTNCAECHNPHGIDRAQEQAGHRCEGCHEVMLDATAESPTGHRACGGCHRAHETTGESRASCTPCHAAASAAASAVAATVRSDDSSQPRTHASCASCHLPHRWVATSDGCVGCHDVVSAELGADAPDGHARCDACHDAHDTAGAARRCVSCHPALGAHATGATAGHRACDGCHAPHGGGATSCATCHGAAARTLSASSRKEHAALACGKCHASHGNAKAGAKACEGCHDATLALARTAPSAEHQRCESCHTGHDFGATDASCRSCHEAAVRAGMHQGACRDCHASHGPAAVPTDRCTGCHEGIPVPATRAKTHASCASCHGDHEAAGAGAAACVRCHKSEVEAATRWAPGSPHSGPCAGCHEPHAARPTASCQSCHGAEAKAEQGSRHRCVQCHDAHRPPPSTVATYWRDCNGCHSAEARGSLAIGPTHATCSNCHQPHGFRAAGCSSPGSCHGDVARLGAHATAEHRECARCHATHEKKVVGRAQCVPCHQDLLDHYPESPRCQSCHPFQ